MRTRLTLLAAIAAALAAPAGATAGGWATVGLDLPPEGLAPGEPWQVELTILQHGRTPLEGVKPRVIVGREDGGGEQAFPARPTGEPGIYKATVVFDSAGTWSYRVDDGFAAEHSYLPVEIAGGAGDGRTAASSGGGPDYLLALGAAAVAALAAGLGAASFQRRRGGPSPAGG